jgi:hypothetical protein
MSESMFEGLDLEGAADDPFAIPDGVYDAFVTEFRVGPTKDKSKNGLTTIFRISEGEHEGKTVQRWLLVPSVADPKNPTAEEAKAMSFIKSHLLSLGVPAERVNTVTAEDIVGTEVEISIKNANGYTNVRKISVKQEGQGSFGL